MKELKMCSFINFSGCHESISEYYILCITFFIVSRTKKKIFKSIFDFALTVDVKSEAIFS